MPAEPSELSKKGEMSTTPPPSASISTEEKTVPAKPAPDGSPRWLKIAPIVLSLCAIIISLASFLFAIGYLRPHQDHDVVAKVVSVRPRLKGETSKGEPEVAVTLALINRGNQTEIIRDVSLCYSQTNDFRRYSRRIKQDAALNLQLAKGEKRLVELVEPFSAIGTGSRVWLGVAVRAISPNADDTEIIWPVCSVELAADGRGASNYRDDQRLVQIISNKRMSHQRLVWD